MTRRSSGRPRVSRPTWSRLALRPVATSSLSAVTMLAVDDQGETGLVVAHRSDRRPGQHRDAFVGERLLEQLGGLRLLDRDQAVGHLDHGDVDAVAGEDLRELAADRPATEHHDRPGQLGHRDGVAVGPVRRPLQALDRRRGGLGAGVEHDALAGGVRRAADADPAGTGEHAPAAHEAGAAVLEPLDRDGVVPVVGGLVTDPLGHRCPVGLDPRGAAEVGDLARVGDHVRGRDHHLRRHAAVVGALPADQPVLDPDDVEPGASELDGDVLAARSEPEHDDVALDLGSCRDVGGHCWTEVPGPREAEHP